MPEIIAPIPFSLTGEPLRAYEQQEWESFKLHLTGFLPHHIADIENAYNFAQEKHRGSLRVSGHRSFDHSREAALSLIQEAGHKDPDTINTTLLHDLEDTPYLKSVEVDQNRELTMLLNDRVALGVFCLSIYSPFGKKEAEREFKRDFPGYPGYIQLARMADRLQNLRTLSVMTQEQQYRKILDTYWLIPRCKNAREDYPEETKILTGLLDEAMQTPTRNLSSIQKQKLINLRATLYRLVKASSRIPDIIHLPREKLTRALELP